MANHTWGWGLQCVQVFRWERALGFLPIKLDSPGAPHLSNERSSISNLMLQVNGLVTCTSNALRTLATVVPSAPVFTPRITSTRCPMAVGGVWLAATTLK